MGKRGPRKEIISPNYQHLDNCSDNKTQEPINIDSLVDNLLAKNKVTIGNEKFENSKVSKSFNNLYLRKSNRKFLWNRGEIRRFFGKIDPLRKKVFSFLLSLLMIFVTIASAPFVIIPDEHGFDVLSISLEPDQVYNNDTIFVNVTVPTLQNISSISCDMDGIETIDLSLSIGTPEQLWQAQWVVHDADVGEHIATITAIVDENLSYSSEITWSVLPEEIINDTNFSEPLVNETVNDTSAGVNESFNETGGTSQDEQPTQGDETQNVTDEPVNISITPELSIWDVTDYEERYVGEQVTFYANCSADESIENVTCLISFNLGNWTEPFVMSYSNGIYSYSRSFDSNGAFEFKVVCLTNDHGNKTVVSEFVILAKEPIEFEPVSQVEIGKPVHWMQSFDVENNLTLNITGYAYNISVNDTGSDAFIVENVSKSLEQYNIDKRKHVLAKKIKDLLKTVKKNPDELYLQEELYQLYSTLKGVSSKEVYNETYEDIEQYISQFVFEYDTVTLVVSNVSGEIEVEYYTEEPKVTENDLDDSLKEVTVYSDVHYEDILTYTNITESPGNIVKLYWMVNGSYVLVSNATLVDTNNNGLIDKVEWITPHLSNQSYLIVITKAEHLNENRDFISDIYDEVYRKDDVWSEPIYHDEFVRVTFKESLTAGNDITIYARNNERLDTLVEVYYYNSSEKITQFPVISQEDYYKIYLTGMTGSHQTFDLKVKNLDSINSTFLEFDYIVDPETKDGVDFNTSDNDSSADKGTETNFNNIQNKNTPNGSNMTIQEADQGWSGVNENLAVDGYTGDAAWQTQQVTSPYLDASDETNYIFETTTDGADSRWFTYADTSATGSGFTTHLWVEFDEAGGENLNWYIDTNGDDTPEHSGIYTASSTGLKDLGAISGLDTADEINAARLWCEYDYSGSSTNMRIDYAYLNIQRTEVIDYEVNFEYNWSTADNDEYYEWVCIYVNDSTAGEILNVNYWSGSWTPLGTIAADATGWQNFTATGLTKPTYTIQLVGAVESGDSTQDSWDIDVISLWTRPIVYGVLNITWADDSELSDSHTSGSPLAKNTNETFTMNATITCDGATYAECGDVTLGSRYQYSGGVMNYTNTTAGDTPFFVEGEGGGGTGDILSGTWYNMTSSANIFGGTLYERYHTGFAYYASVDRFILFGGSDVSGNEFGDTWEYNLSTNTWVNRSPSTAPSRRYGHYMVYDSDQDLIILFGGRDYVNTYLSDTWAYNYDNNTWWNRSPSIVGGNFRARYKHEMAYDSAVQKIIMHGGSTPIFANDTWAYDYSTNTWTNRSPNIVGNNFYRRDTMGFEYDPINDKIIMFGGFGRDNPGVSNEELNDTWAYNYDNNTWWNRTPSYSGGILERRDETTMVYDSNSDRMLMHGGADVGNIALNDTWVYNYTDNKWYNVSASFSGGTLYRKMFGMAYDSTSGKIVLFGGNKGEIVGAPETNTTWIYNYTGGAENPVNLGTMNLGDSQQVNFTINVSGSSGTWKFDLNATSSLIPNVADNNTDPGYVLIGEAGASVPTVVTNASTGVEETNATLWGYLSDNGTVDTTCGFRYGTSTGSYSENFSKGVTAEGAEFSNNNGSLNQGDAYYYQAWGINSEGFASGSELKFFTKPPKITNLAESSSTNTTLTYTWTNASITTGADNYTRIQYQVGSNPTSISDGTNTYNDTGTSDDTTSEGDLTPGTRYYFSAFSWGIEDSVGNWNDTYATMDAWTNPGDPTGVATVNGSTWVNVTFTHGTNGDKTHVRRNTSGVADYPASITDGDFVINTTNAYANDTGLNSEVKYYYSLWTWDTDGSKYCDNKNYTNGTTTASGADTSFDVNRSTWHVGSINLDENATVTNINLTNEGDVNIDIQIKGDNATNSTTGFTWNLTTAINHNNFSLQYNKTPEGGEWTYITFSYAAFIAALPPSGTNWQTFDLRIFMANTSDMVKNMSLDITFKSVAS